MSGIDWRGLLPQHLNWICGERAIIAYEGQIIMNGLRDKEPIKGVFVMKGQLIQ